MGAEEVGVGNQNGGGVMAKKRKMDDVWFVQRPQVDGGVDDWYDMSGPHQSLKEAVVNMKASGDGEYRIARIQRWQKIDTEEVVKEKILVTDMMPKAPVSTTPEPEATPDPVV